MSLNQLVDSRDVRFVLFELLETDKLGKKFTQYAEFDRDIYEDILNLAERIAVEQMYPASAEGDKQGCRYDPQTKQVSIPDCYKAPLDAYYEAGFIGISDEQNIGGMGMPYVINAACSEYFLAASIPIQMYPGLSHGAMNLIKKFGSDEMKRLYIGKLMSGAWGGTMCLTEAEAGTDVGLGKSKAVRQADGSYLISGQNIFISSGDNDYYENMVHLKLARIDGDPQGTKGLSIFVVPKYRVNPDGSIGQFNDVTCAGIEHKMGIKGSATCTLSFGENGSCAGYLLGNERQGLKIMLHMMNEERIGVGIMGLAISSTAYNHAVTYARNRIQGVHVTQMLNPEAKAVSISQHPDVKRMLLWMKSYVEGMRIMAYFLAQNQAIAESGSAKERKEAAGLSEFLRPILKAGCTDTAVLVSSEAVQVYGGYGYCSDYPVERLMRDSKITTIYEGTNGVQAMDFTMRRVLMNPEQYNLSVFTDKVSSTIKQARGTIDEKYIAPIEKGMKMFNDVVEKMKGEMSQGKFMHLFMNATPLQNAMFLLVMAWGHLWSLTKTVPKMNEIFNGKKGDDRSRLIAENSEAAYYSGRVLSAQFYIANEFPLFFSRIDALMCDDTSVLKISDAQYTGALA